MRINLKLCAWIVAMQPWAWVSPEARYGSRRLRHHRTSTTRIIRKIRTTSWVYAMDAMTTRIAVTTPRRGSSKKKKTRKLTSLAIGQATRAIHKTIDNEPGHR